MRRLDLRLRATVAYRTVSRADVRSGGIRPQRGASRHVGRRGVYPLGGGRGSARRHRTPDTGRPLVRRTGIDTLRLAQRYLQSDIGRRGGSETQTVVRILPQGIHLQTHKTVAAFRRGSRAGRTHHRPLPFAIGIVGLQQRLATHAGHTLEVRERGSLPRDAERCFFGARTTPPRLWPTRRKWSGSFPTRDWSR